MWQCGAVTHLALSTLNTPTTTANNNNNNNNNNTTTPLVLVERLVRQLALVPSVCFCERTVEGLIAIYRWLMVAADSSNIHVNNNDNSRSNNNHRTTPLSLALFTRRLITTEITTLLTHTRRLHLGMFSMERVNQGGLTVPGSYGSRAPAFTTETNGVRAALTLQTSSSTNPSLSSPLSPVLGARVHELLVAFCEGLLRSDVHSICLPVLFRGVTALLLQSQPCSSHSGTRLDQQASIFLHPHAAPARFRLLSLGMRVLRRAVSAPGVPIRCSSVSTLPYYPAPPISPPPFLIYRRD